MSQVHPQARTTPRTRAEIRSSKAPLTELAERYNVTLATIRKWRGREDMQDRSHCPNTLGTTLSPAQESLVVELRRTLLLPLDDLLALAHEFINADVSRSGLDRCLRRHGVGNLASLMPVIEGEVPAKKTFKDYEPGYLHVDIKYLPQMPDERHRRYLFVAIDRATRWVYFRIYRDQSEASSTDFLRRLQRVAPMVIQKVLTDNGSQFTDRFTSTGKKASGAHAFDVACTGLGIEHRLAPPRHPQTNGMVERFNGRISGLVAQTRFSSAAELESTLKSYLSTYNHSIPQRALKHQTPIQALKEWQAKKPDLFVKRVYEQSGLDSYRLALFCAISSKAGRLSWLKIHAPEAWPEGEDIRPANVYVDGGPGASKKGRAAMNRLDIDFELAPPDTPYWKASVEGGLGHLQAAQAQSPGGYARTNEAVEKDAKRIAKLHANATLWEFERALVLDIIDYNARVQENARLSDEMKRAGVLRTANDIFHHGVQRMGGVSHRRILAAEAYEQLLEHKTVQLAAAGVRLLNSRYNSERMQRHFLQFGKCRINVFFDPLRPKKVFWRTPDGVVDGVERDRESQRQNGLASSYDLDAHRLHLLAAEQMDTRSKPNARNKMTQAQREIVRDAMGEGRKPVRKVPTKAASEIRRLEAQQVLHERPYDQAEKVLPFAAQNAVAETAPGVAVSANAAEVASAGSTKRNTTSNVVPLKRSRTALLFEQMELVNAKPTTDGFA